jgi:hypothetical protein
MNVYPARAAFAVRSIVIKVASRSAIILDILMIFSAECLSEYLGWRRIPAPDRRGGVLYPVARTGGGRPSRTRRARERPSASVIWPPPSQDRLWQRHEPALCQRSSGPKKVNLGVSP